MLSTKQVRRGMFPTGLVFLGLLLQTAVVFACDTPVYRYAMYKWAAAPYEVYFLHEDRASSEHEQIHALIENAGEDETHPANVVVVPVDLKQDPELAQTVPPDIRQAWQECSTKSLPAYIISTPQGSHLHTGALTAEDAEKLLESPARSNITKQLESGCAGVFVLLSSSDPKADKKAEQNVTALVSDLKQGKVPLYSIPAPEVEEGEPAQQATVDLALVKVDRTDPAEAWFVKQLLAIESDLAGIDQPMVFVIYGRGRLLPPCVGAGIERTVLVDQYVEFITGACSCTVKEQNPGMDLLVRYDWEVAAAKLADKFGAEEGNETIYGAEDFFPQLMIPPSDATPAKEIADSSTGEEPAAGHGVALASAEQDVADDDVPAAEESNSSNTTTDESLEVASVIEQESVAPASPGQTRSAYGSVMVVGFGVAAALLGLFAATLYVLRPR